VPDIRSLKQAIEKIIDKDPLPCLWFSGGNDSMLLLHVLLELNKPFGILRFDDGWNAAQRKAVDAVIREKNLQVFSYPALSHLLVGNDAEMSLASLYAVDFEGNGTLMIRDMVHDPDCPHPDPTMRKRNCNF
jgi:predicted phosphoadenosine phosphosulfate sulfurtransferase